MAGTNVDVTTGLAVVFGTSGFSGNIMNVGFPGISRESIDTSHLGTSLPSAGNFGAKTFIPADLVDAGEFTLEVHFNPLSAPPIEDAAEVVTVTWPLVSGDATSSIWVFTAFTTGFDITGPLDDKMVATMTMKITGEADVTAAT